MTIIFFQRKELLRRHLLNTLNMVIRPKENFLATVEKKVSPLFSSFLEYFASKSLILTKFHFFYSKIFSFQFFFLKQLKSFRRTPEDALAYLQHHFWMYSGICKVSEKLVRNRKNTTRRIDDSIWRGVSTKFEKCPFFVINHCLSIEDKTFIL